MINKASNRRDLGPRKAPQRNLAAPFQHKSQSRNSSHCNTQPLHSNGGYVDYRNFKFQKLDEFSEITFEKYCGPTPESNWVIPGSLLVGAYPASQDDEETYELITSILKEGVTKFVCLQQEYRDEGVTEEMWRSGGALRPYFRDVQTLVRNKALFPDLYDFQNEIVDFDRLSFVHFPIRDCSVTDDDRVMELAKSLVKAISQNEVIYLHCWGGHGRTGTLVCIMLHLMYALDSFESMRRCQFVHDLRRCPVVVGSPQTQTQRDQVVRIIHQLTKLANRFSTPTSRHVDETTGTKATRLTSRHDSRDHCMKSKANAHAHDSVNTSNTDDEVSHDEQKSLSLSHAATHPTADNISTGLRKQSAAYNELHALDHDDGENHNNDDSHICGVEDGDREDGHEGGEGDPYQPQYQHQYIHPSIPAMTIRIYDGSSQPQPQRQPPIEALPNNEMNPPVSTGKRGVDDNCIGIGIDDGNQVARSIEVDVTPLPSEFGSIDLNAHPDRTVTQMESFESNCDIYPIAANQQSSNSAPPTSVFDCATRDSGSSRGADAGSLFTDELLTDPGENLLISPDKKENFDNQTGRCVIDKKSLSPSLSTRLVQTQPKSVATDTQFAGENPVNGLGTVDQGEANKMLTATINENNEAQSLLITEPEPVVESGSESAQSQIESKPSEQYAVLDANASSSISSSSYISSSSSRGCDVQPEGSCSHTSASEDDLDPPISQVRPPEQSRSRVAPSVVDGSPVCRPTAGAKRYKPLQSKSTIKSTSSGSAQAQTALTSADRDKDKEPPDTVSRPTTLVSPTVETRKDLQPQPPSGLRPTSASSSTTSSTFTGLKHFRTTSKWVAVTPSLGTTPPI